MEYFKEVILPTLKFALYIVLYIFLMICTIHFTGIDQPVRFLFLVGAIFLLPKLFDKT